MPVPGQRHPDVYVAVQSPAARVPAFGLASELRRAGIATLVGASERSLRAQMGHADALGARYVAILGERELADGSITLKDLANGAQDTIPIHDVADHIDPSSPG